MPNSMTGYGRAVNGAITVEMRSVNHRFLEVSVRTPRSFSFLEEPLKTLAAQTLGRGKVEIGVFIENSAGDTIKLSLNSSVLEGVLLVARELEEKYGLRNDLTVSSALRFPDVLSASKQEPETETVTEMVKSVMQEALAGFCDMRAREGGRLAQDIEIKLAEIERLADKIETRMPSNVEAYRERLREKLNTILEQKSYDEARILTEAAIYADRICADEELVRLRSHIAALRGMLLQKGAVGRKMDFLVQEFSREANTIGSKCSDTETVGFVVELKSEIEKIREQVQNIE